MLGRCWLFASVLSLVHVDHLMYLEMRSYGKQNWSRKHNILISTCDNHLGGHVRARTEIVPDQRERYLQKFQQVQQGQSALLNMPSYAGGNHKQFSAQQQNPLLQQ
ncbi:hypothetical protein V8G54_012383, partial [Vigna mungo]